MEVVKRTGAVDNSVAPPPDCTMCGVCCRTNNIPMTVQEKELVDQYVAIQKVPTKTGPQCPYLQKNGQCGIYPVRPKICRITPCPRGRLSSDDRMIRRGEEPPRWMPPPKYETDIRKPTTLSEMKKIRG